jgi:hypothetical protein
LALVTISQSYCSSRSIAASSAAQSAGGAIAQFLGVVVDGIVVHRALGFDPPRSDVVLRFVRDATRARHPEPSSAE